MTTDLVLDAVEHAFFIRAQDGTTSLRGLIAHSDYAEVCVKPRFCRDGLRWWGVLADSRLNVSWLSEAVEGVELVGVERFGGRGVDGGCGGVDRLAHHVQGCKGVESGCGGSIFVAEETHDDR